MTRAKQWTVVVAVNGVRTPAGGLVRRLLRRAVLVAAFTGAGWLLGVIFAGTASATPPPPDNHPPRLPLQVPALIQEPTPPTKGLAPVASLIGAAEHLDDLLAGLAESVTGTVEAATESNLADLPAAFPPPNTEPSTEPTTEPTTEPSTEPAVQPEQTQLLPVVGTLIEGRTADEPAARVRPRTPAAPRAPPTAAAPEHTPGQVGSTVPTRRTSGDTGTTATEHAHQSPRQDKAPAPLPGGGPTATTVHDNSTGVRGTHGALAAPAPFEPTPAGFSARGRTADVSGRIAGLPATSPD